VDENGEPVDKEAIPAVQDGGAQFKKAKKGGKKEDRDRKKGAKPKEITGRSNLKVRINEDTGDEEDEPQDGTGFEK